MSKKVIFIVDGGIGKNIMATALLPGLKEKYDLPVIVVTAWPGVYSNNSNIETVYRFGETNYFYDHYIRDKEFVIIKSEPYLHPDYIRQKRHLIDVWCEQIEVENKSKPEVFLDEQLMTSVKNRINYNEDKPILAMHIHGGPINANAISWPRQIQQATANEIANNLKKKYRIFQIALNGQPAIEDTEPFVGNNVREVFALLKLSQKRLLIDSFPMHASAALELPSVVVWGPTNPELLGYSMHHNIVPENLCPQPFCHRPNSYLYDIIPGGEPWTCPYKVKCMTQINALKLSNLF
jgi:hypothetical protein